MPAFDHPGYAALQANDIRYPMISTAMFAARQRQMLRVRAGAAFTVAVWRAHRYAVRRCACAAGEDGGVVSDTAPRVKWRRNSTPRFVTDDHHVASILATRQKDADVCRRCCLREKECSGRWRRSSATVIAAINTHVARCRHASLSTPCFHERYLLRHIYCRD